MSIDFSVKKLLSKSAAALLLITALLSAESDHSATEDSIQNKEQKKIILISRPHCGACTKAKQFLDLREVKYTQYDVKRSKKGKRLFKKHKGRGVPMIIIGKEIIHGFDPGAILNAL